MESYNDSKPRRKSRVIQSNDAVCNTEIAQFIHAGDHPLNLGECLLFKDVIASAHLTSKQYKPPKRKIVGGTLLEDNFDLVKVNNDTQLQKDSSTYGITEMGDGSKIVKIPLFNVLVSTYGTYSVVIKVHYCSRHLAGGGKKDAEYIAKIFLSYMEGLDP